MFQLTKNFILVRCLLNKNLEKLVKKTQKNKNEQNDVELADNFDDKFLKISICPLFKVK